jgi:hypothetical protein
LRTSLYSMRWTGTRLNDMPRRWRPERRHRRLLPRRPSYADVANAAVFAASDWAPTMTATEINLTGGAVVD